MAPDGLDRLALPRPHGRRGRGQAAGRTVQPHQQVDDQAVEPQPAARQPRLGLGMSGRPARSGSGCSASSALSGSGCGSRSARSTPGFSRTARFVIGQPAIVATTVMFMLFNVGFGIILVLLPVYAQTVLAGGAGAAGFGLLSSALAGGELAGAAAAGMVTSRWPLGRAIALSQLAAGAFLLGLVALPQLPGAVAFLALSAFCTGPLTVWAQTLRVRLIPAHLRGRVFGLLRTSMQAAPPLGGLAASALLTGPGLRVAVLATALLIGLPGAGGLLLRSLSTPAGTDPARVRRD
jgi:hypothetical protein